MALPGSPEPRSIASALRSVYRVMTPRRRRHLYAALALTLLGALAELLTIGAVIPFLAVVANPASVQSMPLFGDLLAAFGANSPGDVVLTATIILISVAVGAAIIRLVLAWVSQTFVFRLGSELGALVYHRMLRMPYILFVQRNTSELVAGVEKVEAVVIGVLLPLMLSVTSAVVALFIVAALFMVDPLVATIAAATMSVIYVCIAWFTRRRLRANSAVISANRTKRIQQIQEGLGGLRDIILDGSQPMFDKKFRAINDDLNENLAFNAFVGAAPRFIVEAAGIVLIAIVAYFVSLKPGGLMAAIPVLGALAIGAQRLLPLVQQAYVGWSNFAGHSYYLRDVLALAEAPVSPVAGRPGDRAVSPIREEIVLRGVGFSYPDGKKALSDIDLSIAKGERVGFIGRTGSGKSTLLDLLMGLLEPSGGTIEIDGVALSDATRANWQAQIAHVPQSIYLSDSSIASNIAFGQDPAEFDWDRIRAAAREAQIEELIAELPQGYDTDVGERGIRLSGGQRQRIGIARALYKRARVLLFDEATSALDNETETAVMQTIEGLGRDLTVIMIAHRLSTVAKCDRVIRLEGGRIVADGSFDEVAGPMKMGKR